MPSRGRSGRPRSPRRHPEWLTFFTRTVQIAVKESAALVKQIVELLSEWRERVAQARTDRGMRETPRSGSATARLPKMLPEGPVLTAGSVCRFLGVSFPAASFALEELRDAKVLDTRKIARNATAYLATEVLDLITLTERRLASTRFDTRKSPPSRAVPARPRDQ